MERKNITLRDVAAKVGVSLTTVACALRERGRMTNSLRQRIKNCARDLGYQSDPIISAGMAQMRRGPAKRIESGLAWLDATPSRESLETNPVFRRVWKGAFAQASDLGYKMERYWLNDPDLPAKRVARILKARGIEGLIVLQYYQAAKHSIAPSVDFDFKNFACVSVSTRLSSPDIPFAQADHFACAELALRELHSLGYRRIGLACPPSVDALTQRRIYSAYEGFVRHYPEMIRLPIFVDESKSEQEMFLSWLRAEKPDVILGWKPPSELQKLGFKVPEEIGVCMLDHLPEYGDCAGVNQNHLEIGAAAVRLLQAQLQQGLRGIPSISTATMVEGKWLSGSSLVAQNIGI